MDFFSTYISDKAIDNVKKVLDSGFVSNGKGTRFFEKEIGKKINNDKVVATNSGTSSLHLALESCGIKSGDEVLLPAQTFIASALAILYTGAIPVFVDINIKDGNISVTDLKNKITNKTRAIMTVDWGGCPCDYDEINSIARDEHLIVISDSAHSFNSEYKGMKTGSITDFTCFSFQAIKHLTASDGGLVSCLNDIHYQNARKKSWFGIDRENDLPNELGERQFNLTELGFKYHMNDYASALVYSNLLEIDDVIERNRAIADKYRKEIKTVSPMIINDYKKSSYWLYTILVERRTDFIRYMKENNIPVSVVHQGIDRHTLFGGIDWSLENQREFDERQINIPIHDQLKDEEVERIIEVVNKGW